MPQAGRSSGRGSAATGEHRDDRAGARRADADRRRALAEVHEQLGGYYIVDCRDLDEALELAALCPMAEDGSIEVRPVAEVPGLHPELDALRAILAEE